MFCSKKLTFSFIRRHIKDTLGHYNKRTKASKRHRKWREIAKAIRESNKARHRNRIKKYPLK